MLILGLKPKNENTYSHTGSYILGLNHFNLGIKKTSGPESPLFPKKNRHRISPPRAWNFSSSNSPPTQLASFMLTFEASSTHQVATGRRVLVEAQVLPSRCGGRTSATNDSRVQNAVCSAQQLMSCKAVPKTRAKLSPQNKKNNSFGFGSVLYFLTFVSLVGMRSESPWQLATS